MVHYEPAPSRPSARVALCPKCGSHRTEIVGKSMDDAVVVIRCNVCGERSEIVNPARGEDVSAFDVTSLMKAFVVGGDFRRRLRAGGLQG